MAGGAHPAAQPFTLGRLELANRIVGTPHGTGDVRAGVPMPADADYWRRRAAGGAAMLIVGGTLVAPESTSRNGISTDAWRREAQPGMAARAEAIRAEGAVAGCQIVHLGRETLLAETWFHPVAPSPVRSPREPTRPRPLTDSEVNGVVEAFVTCARNVHEAGFQVLELHAAHGYLLAQFLSAATNHRPGAEAVSGRVAILERIVHAIRASVPDTVVGVRLSTEGGEEAGFGMDGLCELLPFVTPLMDYVNLTVGVRTTYVKDMGTEGPPLLADVERIRAVVDGPLLISQSFRRGHEIAEALAAGADLVGVARPLIADPDMPAKILSGREATVRPCVSCNEDCRAFDPALLCSVNPDLGPPGHAHRPAAPLVAQRGGSGSGRRVAIVGAGPAGLECALRLGEDREVVLLDEREAIGGQLAVAAAAPHRAGWGRLLDFYRAGIDALDTVELRLGTRVAAEDLGEFDDVVLAVGSHEVLPDLPGIDRALTSSAAIARGADDLGGEHLLVVDDGFGWWPCASAVELGVRAGFASIVVVTPAAAFGAQLPPEGRVQLIRRLMGAPLELRTFTALSALEDGYATLHHVLSGATERIPADAVIAVGERRAADWGALVPGGATVRVIGDALVPRRVAHAVSEARAAAESLALTEVI